jgi:hypothetical protein
MVADVTAGERRLAELSGDMFPTTRLQLSFGLHVIVTMGAFFALGFYGARFATGSNAWVGACLRLAVSARRRACEAGCRHMPLPRPQADGSVLLRAHVDFGCQDARA